ncbi:MAG: phage holin [Firmicutes bacterium]|nr:phage holin [Bacillota bacterium]
MFRNRRFSLIGIILTAVGATPEMFTSWTILIEQVKSVFYNPFLLGCCVVAIVGYINDPTTQGISDSKQALTYQKPKKD